MNHIDLGLLILRATFGLFLAYHGYNKVFGGGGLAGTASWFGSMGMKWPKLQARMAAATEIGAGLLLAVGLITPFAAAGIIGVMVVAIITCHWKVGFFVFLPNQGWEYCGTILLGGLAVGTMGAGDWSLDNALDITFNGWVGPVITAALGIGGGLLQLAVCYRPVKAS